MPPKNHNIANDHTHRSINVNDSQVDVLKTIEALTQQNELADEIDLLQCYDICDHIYDESMQNEAPGPTSMWTDNAQILQEEQSSSLTEDESDNENIKQEEHCSSPSDEETELKSASTTEYEVDLHTETKASNNDYDRDINASIESYNHTTYPFDTDDIHVPTYCFHSFSHDVTPIIVSQPRAILKKLVTQPSHESYSADANVIEETPHYIHLNQLTSQNYLSTVHGVYLSGHPTNTVLLHQERYQALSYDKTNTLYGTINETVVPVLLDNGASMTLMPTEFYEKTPKLHSLPKSPVQGLRILTGNGPVEHHFAIDCVINIHGLRLALKVLVCNTQAKTGILLGSDVFTQLSCWQDYESHILYIKQLSIPLRICNEVKIPPGHTSPVDLKLWYDETSWQTQDNIEGPAVVFLHTHGADSPPSPFRVDFINNRTRVNFQNKTDKIMLFKQDYIMGCMDIRSKLPPQQPQHQALAYHHETRPIRIPMPKLDTLNPQTMSPTPTPEQVAGIKVA